MMKEVDDMLRKRHEAASDPLLDDINRTFFGQPAEGAPSSQPEPEGVEDREQPANDDTGTTDDKAKLLAFLERDQQLAANQAAA